MDDMKTLKIFGLYSLFFLVYFFPMVTGSQVIAPHPITTEIGSPESTSENSQENRKFFDYPRSKIPSLIKSIYTKQSGLMSTWDHWNGLGQPVVNSSGRTQNYPLTWIASQFISDPYELYTFIALSSCYLAGIFLLLWCRELGLSSIASLLAALSVAVTPAFMWWLVPFSVFILTTCWCIAILFAMTRMANKGGFTVWVLLCFFTYNYLIAGHPQLIVHQSYLIVGYALVLLYRKCWKGNSIKGVGLPLAMFSAMFGGLLMASPYLIDLFQFKMGSSRDVAPSIDFFTQVFSRINSIETALRYLSVSTFPEVYGNPISADYPLIYKGHYNVSVSIFTLVLALTALITRWRHVFGWFLAVILFFTLELSSGIFTFFWQYLGLNLSRLVPSTALVIPITIMSAYGADALLRRPKSGKTFSPLLAAILTVAGLLAAVLLSSLYLNHPALWPPAIILLLVLILFWFQLRRTKPLLLFLCLALPAVFLQFPMILRVDTDRIVGDSPLVALMKKEMPEGSRFAVTSPDTEVLLPNINTIVGLKSVHTYIPLSSRRYHLAVEEMGGKMGNMWRWNIHIEPNYDNPTFWMSNISLLLSPERLSHDGLIRVGMHEDLNLYRVQDTMGNAIQVSFVGKPSEETGLSIPDPRTLPHKTARKIEDLGDLLKFEVDPMAQSLLVLSQLYYPNWRATGWNGDHWISLETTPVNKIFQGALLPEGVSKVRLKFEPYIPYTMYSYFCWIIFLLIWVAKNGNQWIRRKQLRPPEQ